MCVFVAAAVCVFLVVAARFFAVPVAAVLEAVILFLLFNFMLAVFWLPLLQQQRWCALVTAVMRVFLMAMAAFHATVIVFMI